MIRENFIHDRLMRARRNDQVALANELLEKVLGSLVEANVIEAAVW